VKTGRQADGVSKDVAELLPENGSELVRDHVDHEARKHGVGLSVPSLLPRGVWAGHEVEHFLSRSTTVRMTVLPSDGGDQ